MQDDCPGRSRTSWLFGSGRRKKRIERKLPHDSMGSKASGLLVVEDEFLVATL